jgi:succinate-acetate transporter protein
MAIFTLIMLVCSTRVNVVLVVLLSSILIGFLLIAAALFVENQAAQMGAEATTLLKNQDLAAAQALDPAILNNLKLASRLTTVSQPSDVTANWS